MPAPLTIRLDKVIRGAAQGFKGAPRLPLPPLLCVIRGAALALGLCHAGAATAEISSARFTDPTTRYPHGVLGDAVEWGALEIKTTEGQGRTLTYTLPQNLVFEDLAPRLVDVDGTAGAELVVVESHQDKGARLAVWNETGRIAATPFIGRSNRWLAPIGAADLDGDGFVEIAYIDRPHLAKVLRVWRFKDGGVTQIAAASKFSNHQIGWDYILGGIRDCGTGPEMIVATGDWQTLMAVQLKKGALHSKALTPFSANAMSRAMECGQ